MIRTSSAALGALWFDWTIDTWPLLMAVLVGLGCGLLGSVFLLRRSALLGDAVSHSVLPGIAGGFIAAGLLGAAGGDQAAFGLTPSMLFVVGGALIAGLCATGLIGALFRRSRLKPDTALGSVFPAFFAAGVLLIELYAGGAHFDSDCVFYGALELIDGFPRVAPTLAATVAVVAFFALAHKEILVTSFDAGYSRTIGIHVRLIDNTLVALLTGMVVCAFEAVGAILVIAFLVVPPATAYLLSDRFGGVVMLSAAFGVTAGVLGCWGTVALEHVDFATSRAPTMALAAGVQFLVALFIAPRRGLLAGWRGRAALSRRIVDENFLGALYRLAARRGSADDWVPLDWVADSLGLPLSRLRPALRRELRRGEVADHGDGRVRLTPGGRARVEGLVRAHRLWESWMAREMGTPPDHVHDAADRIEHYLRSALVEELDALLQHPTYDVHGSAIPGRNERREIPSSAGGGSGEAPSGG